jgi:hypothetical protein
MKRIAIICTAISAILLVLGVIEAITNYQWSAGDQDPFFGNPRLLMNDGTTVLIAAGLMIVVSAVTWILARRRSQGDQPQS